jgi:ribonuclease G
VQLQQGGVPLFERFGLEKELQGALKRRVGLPSGGYIVFDHAEALTAVDVNTGSHVRGRRLEDTTLKTNVEACREIVHQLRLRDIGGLIVIDFIDMTVDANRDAVVAALKTELALDRTKSYVVEISPLGLVEMTRQNVTPGLHEVLAETCPVCGGEGRVRSQTSALADVERSLRRLAAVSTLAVLRVELHPRMIGVLTGGPASVLAVLEQETGKCIVTKSAGADVPLDHCALVAE